MNNENPSVKKFIDDHHPIDFRLNNPPDDDYSMELKTLSTNDDTERIFLRNKFSNEEEEDRSLSHMDVSFDIQLQVNDGQIQQMITSEIFSSGFEKIHLLQKNSSSYTSEMDMEHGENQAGNTNGYSRRNYNQDKSDRTDDRQTNGTNPNRNNNNSGR